MIAGSARSVPWRKCAIFRDAAARGRILVSRVKNDLLNYRRFSMALVSRRIANLAWVRADPPGFLLTQWRGRNPRVTIDPRMLERRNPLPPGRYWIDVFGNNIGPFQSWLQSNRPSLTVESSRDFTVRGQPTRWWVLFVTRAPLTFDQKRFGFPTVADASVHRSEDTATNAPFTTSDALQEIADFANEKAKAVSDAASGAALPFGIGLGTALLLLGTAYLFTRPSRAWT